jgi:hypothetical protein
MPAGRRFAAADHRFHAGSYFIAGVAESGKASAGQGVADDQQSEQDVLSTDVVVVEFASLFLRADDDVPGLPRESFKHVSIIETLSIHCF